jgi:hypothetical protein
MRIKWVFSILLANFLLTLISCGGGVIRREEISCRPVSAISASATASGRITIAWDFSTDDKIAGYRVFYELSSKKYKNCVDIGPPIESSPGVMKYTLIDLDKGKRYYIAVIAYDKNNYESDLSSEISAVAK